MTDEERPRLFARARAGDWDAIEDLVAGALAPTFDAAWHLFGEPRRAEQATEDALLSMVRAVLNGSLADGEPLCACARELAQAVKTAGVGPFPQGLEPADMIAIARRPDDARRHDLGKVASADRTTAVLAGALDLSPAELGAALDRSAADVRAALDRVLAAIPHETPPEAFRAILDARAAAVRVPIDVEERVLDRLENP